MHYSVIYRNKSGQRESKVFEAANRAELFRVLENEKISAIRIDEVNNLDTREKYTAITRFKIIFALTTLILVVLGVGYYFINDEEKTPIKQSAKKDVIPSIPKIKAAQEKPPKKVELPSQKEEKKVDPRYAIPEGAYRDERGILRTPTGRRILEREPTRFLSMRSSNRPRVFTASAEEDIARLIVARPGQFFIPGVYGQRFINSFKKSLEQPTIILEEDSEETKELKRQVIEIKADLKARMDAGEDISKIMEETENELRAMSAYQKDLTSELKALRLDDSVSDEEFEDYVKAANILLKERGMGEIKMPKIHQARLKQLREMYKARQLEREKTNKVKRRKVNEKIVSNGWDALCNHHICHIVSNSNS